MLARGIEEQLFDFERAETTGDRVHFKVLELFLLGYAVSFAWQWGFQIQSIAAVAVPHGIARDIDISFLVGHPTALINAALISACALGGLWPRAARLTLPLLVVLMHFQYAARYSLGKVTHGTHYVGLGLAMLALAPWIMPSPLLRRRFVVGGTLFFMGLGYVFAAISKLVAKGAAWPNGNHLWLWIEERSLDQLANLGHRQLNAAQELCLSSWIVATLCLAGGLLAELSGFLLWFRRMRVPVTLALLGLHLGVFATMDIVFDAFMYQLVLLGLPWPRWIDRALDRSPMARKRGALPPRSTRTRSS
jgi:hypothetical protein